MDVIQLRGARVMARVGVPEEERAVAQELVVDVDLDWDIRAAAAADDFELTLDYAAVRAVVERVAGARAYRLIETIGGVAAAVLAEFGTPRVRVLVKKPAALRAVGVEYPAVEIERRRDG
ncbi:MAG: dihydroneopterin aldolase [Solibacteraceae bacterium]|nr:dihydroneopterin aldolase [Solibacteraceae bacterium]